MHVLKSKSYEELGRTNSFSLIDFTKFAHTQNKNFKKENLYKAKVAQVNSKLIVQLRFTFPNGNCPPVEKRLPSTTALVSLVTIADQAVSLYQPAVLHSQSNATPAAPKMDKSHLPSLSLQWNPLNSHQMLPFVWLSNQENSLSSFLEHFCYYSKSNQLANESNRFQGSYVLSEEIIKAYLEPI